MGIGEQFELEKTGKIEPETRSHYPVQTVDHKGGKIGRAVYLKAYEVYCHVHGSQEALVTGWCRGGLSTGEIIAFLYALSFPKSEWAARADLAFKSMEHI